MQAIEIKKVIIEMLTPEAEGLKNDLADIQKDLIDQQKIADYYYICELIKILNKIFTNDKEVKK